MNPHNSKPCSLASLFANSYTNRNLVYQMIRREVIGRYRGSFMGILWSFINPIFMLIVYTFVFSVVFKARWASAVENESKTQFAVILFVGLIVHNLFAEVLNRSPHLIISNVNYVKKVIFPLETLPLVTMGGVLFHSLISLMVLISAFFIFNGYVHWTSFFLPMVILPLIFLTLGLSWFLASLGVYIRDVGQTIAILMTVMMFLSPVFYPITSLPETLRPLIMMNPLTFIIEQARAVLIWGEFPNFIGLGIYSVISLLVMWLGYVWFQKTRKGFADVL